MPPRTTIPPDPNLILFQQSFQRLYQWFPLILYGFIGALSSFIMVYNNMDIVSDRFQATFIDRADTFDFIIGGGTSGSVLSRRFVEQNFSVLLLESGGEPNPFTYIPGISLLMLDNPYIDWRHRTVPQKKSCFALKNRVAGWSQGKGLGGTSNLNFMIHLRGHPKDYDNWANITGDPSWSYNELLPYFKRSENFVGVGNSKYHGYEGEMTIQEPPYKGMADLFVKAAEELGYPKTDLNAPFTEGFTPIYMPIRNGRRLGSYQAFIEPIRGRKSLTIYKFSTVQKVLVRGTNQEAYGVEYERHGEIKQAFAKKEIILSAGAIQSPKILLLSGIGPRKHLESIGIPVLSDLPVGQNLQDHISVYLGPFFIDEPVTQILDRDITASSFVEFTREGKGTLTSPGVQAGGFIVSSYAKATGFSDWPDIQYLLLGTGIYEKMDIDFSNAFHIDRGIMKKYFAHAKGKDSFQIITSLARPIARGSILLKDSNPASSTLIDPKYLEDDRDVQVLIEGMKRALELVENTTTMQNIGGRFTNVSFPGCEHVRFRSDAYWECFARHYSITLHHIAGSCAMGKRDSVVDSELRVIGIRNLRVVDASVMPNLPVSNTNAACLMIGEKGADLITKSWKSEAKENNIDKLFPRFQNILK